MALLVQKDADRRRSLGPAKRQVLLSGLQKSQQRPVGLLIPTSGGAEALWSLPELGSEAPQPGGLGLQSASFLGSLDTNHGALWAAQAGSTL